MLQAGTTCHVISLEFYLNYKLLNSTLRTIYITDGDGITTDFVINVPTGITVDYTQLSAIVNKYKMFGKRFSIGQLNITYTTQWTHPLCELEPKKYNPVELWFPDMLHLGVKTNHATDSDVVVNVLVGAYWQSYYVWIPAAYHDFTIAAGSRYSSTIPRPNDSYQTFEIISVTPEQDATSTYVNGLIAYRNSGYQIATKLSITKFINGIQESVSLFDLKLQFVHLGITYDEITNDELVNLTLDDYTDRITACAAYITSVKQNDYPGIEVSADGSRVQNYTACPIN
jgi:hypothetical protein